MEQDSGLWKRGLILFGLMAALAGVVLLILLREPRPTVAEEPPSSVTRSSPGWEIRYNATQTLARRGSSKVPLDVLAEMLDEAKQLKNFRAPAKDGRDVPDEAAARRTVINALKAVAQWHEKPEAIEKVRQKSPKELEAIYQAIAKLTESPVVDLRNEALRTQAAIKKKS
jgi:hypothetical protein